VEYWIIGVLEYCSQVSGFRKNRYKFKALKVIFTDA
jgi:hypothetical protein